MGRTAEERMRGNDPEREDSARSLYGHCELCPRACGADRLHGGRGVCGMGAEALIARVSLHMWEEPCLSGTRGSGTVFFAGCPLGCIYCQNRSIVSEKQITGGGTDLARCKAVTEEELARIFLRLERAGAHNINLVTAGHFLPQVMAALRQAKRGGLSIPVVYNTSGYESTASLKRLDGLVDIYLTDLRYFDAETAQRLSKAPDYPEIAMQAIREMLCGRSLQFDQDGMLRRGVIVRVLLLPGHVREAKDILRFLAGLCGDDAYISLLSQYTPLPALSSDPLLGRRVTKREYGKLVQYALELGLENVYIQEGRAAEESFIPLFDGEEHFG